jgi:hypothetical protein
LQKPAREQAVAKVEAKELRARDAALAMKEYQAERVAVQARTARLRALRLAKEAGATTSAAPSKTVRRAREKS